MPKLKRVIIWTPMPNHHHDAFHQALINLGVDLQVNYYGRVRQDRVAMGWKDRHEPADFERFIDISTLTLDDIDASAACVHTMPGIGGGFFGSHELRRLLGLLIERKANWVHWSEPFLCGTYSFATLYKWWGYFRHVKKNGLGALANGMLAYRDFLKMGLSPERIVVHPYTPCLPLSAESEALDWPIGPDASVVLYVGQIIKRKGVDVLLRAFERVKQQVPSAVLLIVGPDRSGGWFEAMRTASRFSDTILHVGPQPIERLRACYRQGTVVVVPSRFDGWGAAVSEAASMGVPVVSTSKTGAAHQLIWPGVTGCVVKPGHVDQLANAITKYVSRPAFSRSSGDFMREYHRFYEPSHAARRFVIGIEGLLPQGGA